MSETGERVIANQLYTAYAYIQVLFARDIHNVVPKIALSLLFHLNRRACWYLLQD
jgi:hypothetical protein